MKVRIGVSFGQAGTPDRFAAVVDLLEQAGVDSLLASIRQRRPQADPGTLVAAGWGGARRMIEQYIRAGLSKFVVRPTAPPASFGSFVDGFVRQLTPLQS